MFWGQDINPLWGKQLILLNINVEKKLVLNSQFMTCHHDMANWESVIIAPGLSFCFCLTASISEVLGLPAHTENDANRISYQSKCDTKVFRLTINMWQIGSDWLVPLQYVVTSPGPPCCPVLSLLEGLWFITPLMRNHYFPYHSSFCILHYRWILLSIPAPSVACFTYAVGVCCIRLPQSHWYDYLCHLEGQINSKPMSGQLNVSGHAAELRLCSLRGT